MSYEFVHVGACTCVCLCMFARVHCTSPVKWRMPSSAQKSHQHRYKRRPIDPTCDRLTNVKYKFKATTTTTTTTKLENIRFFNICSWFCSTRAHRPYSTYTLYWHIWCECAQSTSHTSIWHGALLHCAAKLRRINITIYIHIHCVYSI